MYIYTQQVKYSSDILFYRLDIHKFVYHLHEAVVYALNAKTTTTTTYKMRVCL